MTNDVFSLLHHWPKCNSNLSLVLFFILILCFFSSSHSSFSQDNSSNIIQCNCVVFRLDQIQDYWIQKGQIAPMNIFLSKNLTLAMSLIGNAIGNDPMIIDKIRDGSHRGIFELAINGWNHTDYTKLDQSEQEYSLKLANQKMQMVFGNTSDVFVPPMSKFNNATVKAMEKLNLKILSSSKDIENNYNNGKSIFVIASNNSNQIEDREIFHLPSTIYFKDEINGKLIKNSNENILNNITINIENDGYAVVALSPQDFMELDQNGNIIDKLNEDEVNHLSNLIDSIQLQNIKIASFSDIVGINPKVYPYPSVYMSLLAAESEESLNLKSSNPISLEGLADLEYAMAETYNRYGKYIKEKASELGISPEAAAAVIFTETRGLGFGVDGKMLIRFEACSFYDIWGVKHTKEFSTYFQCNRPNDKFRTSSTEQFIDYHGDHYKEWKVFEFARNLDDEAAMKSISMGLGQIMGFNYDKIGYKSVKEMYEHMSSSLKAQLDAFFSALSYKDKNTNKSCLEDLKAKDYVTFAGCYNASGQDEIYGSKMAEAAKAYKKIISERG